MKIKAICFDLGETLIFSGHPLSWSSHYRNALEKGFLTINRTPSDKDFLDCIKILTKYNTRENPRETEINSNIIFEEIMEILEIELVEKGILENAFFEYFQQSNKLYDDTQKILKQIKAYKLKTGILTDVPYGRVKGFIAEDVDTINKNIDIILTSVDVGYRKPNIAGYNILSKKLGTQTDEMVYIGNEEKDIIGANNAGMISVLINRTDETINYGEKYQYKNLLDMWEELKELL